MIIALLAVIRVVPFVKLGGFDFNVMMKNCDSFQSLKTLGNGQVS